MNLSELADRLSTSANAIVSMACVSKEQAHWKPTAKRWSIIEVINHLHDEEREDFRCRVDFMLHKPDDKWPPIDPEGWPAERAYAQKELQESVDRFVEERNKSIEWLRSLTIDPVPFDRSYEHPAGLIRLGDMMLSWAAHDYLHIRQLARLQLDYATHVTKGFSNGYASGEW